jgi:hypothetical protein
MIKFMQCLHPVWDVSPGRTEQASALPASCRDASLTIPLLQTINKEKMTERKQKGQRPFITQRRATPCDRECTHKPSPVRAQSNETDYAPSGLGSVVYPIRRALPCAIDKRSFRASALRVNLSDPITLNSQLSTLNYSLLTIHY